MRKEGRMISKSKGKKAVIPRHATWRWSTRKTTTRSFKFNLQDGENESKKENKKISDTTFKKPTSSNTQALSNVAKGSTKNTNDLKKRNCSIKETPNFPPCQKIHRGSSLLGSKIPVYNFRKRLLSNTSKETFQKSPISKQISNNIISPNDSLGLSPIERVIPVTSAPKGITCSTPVCMNAKVNKKLLSLPSSETVNITYVYKPQDVIYPPILRSYSLSKENMKACPPGIDNRLSDASSVKGSGECTFNLPKRLSQSKQKILSSSLKQKSPHTSNKANISNKLNVSKKTSFKRTMPSRRLSFNVENTYIINEKSNENVSNRYDHPKKRPFLTSSQVEIACKVSKKSPSKSPKRNNHCIPLHNVSITKKSTPVEDRPEFSEDEKHFDKFAIASQLSKGKQTTIHFYFAPDKEKKESVFLKPRITRTKNSNKQNKRPRNEESVAIRDVSFWAGIGKNRNVTDLTDLDIILSSVKDVFQHIRVSNESWRSNPLVQRYATLLEDYLLERIQDASRCQVLKKKINKAVKEIKAVSNTLGEVLDRKFELQENIIQISQQIDERQNESDSWKTLQKLISPDKK